MAIKYPIDCDTPQKKTEWLYRAQELLRLLHNVFSKWLHEGLAKTEYNTIPQKLRDKFPYKLRLDSFDWDRFLKEEFRPRSERICTQINIQRAIFKSSTVWDVDIGVL